jgi:hypothetical protein
MSRIPPIPADAFAALAGRPMQVLLVTYDLKTANHNYSPFYDTLKQQGTWWHYLASTWLIATTKTPSELYGAVVSHITTSDSLLIAPIRRPFWGYLPRDAWDWLNTHVPQD